MIQVEVVNHFNEDGFSYGLAQGLAERLREALQDVRCPEHEGESTVRVSTQGIAQTPNELRVDVSGCCAAVVERVEQILASVRSAADPTGPSSAG